MRKTTPILAAATLLFVFALLHISGAGRILQAALRHAPPPPSPSASATDASSAQSLHIEDDWEGSVQFSPITVHADLFFHAKDWYGEATLSVRSDKRVHNQWQTGYAEKIVPITVPAFVMQRVLGQISHAPLVPIVSQPKQNPFALHPRTILQCETSTGSIKLQSTSQTWDHAPWRVETEDGSFWTRSSAPYQAIRLLRPFLHENELATLKTEAAAQH